jgi:CDP-4-dehydro-6-deoxyglucose reductase, E1
MPIPLMRHTFLEEKDAKDVLCSFIRSSDRLSMGAEVNAFEEAFAKWQGRSFCTMVNSGSSANLILLQSLLNMGRIQRGSRIGVSAVTWATNVMPIVQLGCIPVLIDVNKETLNVSVDTLSSAPAIQCLFLTHLLGFSDAMTSIRDYCESHDILLLEDTCESLGASYAGTKLGNFGLAATFSTFVGHHMSTIEGGMVVTDDAALDAMLKMTRAHGWDRSVSTELQTALRSEWSISEFYAPYTFYTLAYNVRPTELQGVLGQHQLKHIDSANETRRATYAYIRKAVENASHIRIPSIDTPAFAIPVVCDSEQTRTLLVARCRERGIETRPLVAGNMARQPFFQPYHDGRVLPAADMLHTHAFYMPNHPDISEEERNDLWKAIVYVS